LGLIIGQKSIIAGIMRTAHEIMFENAENMELRNNSVGLVVTSPPYPMIEMWDEIFVNMNANISLALAENEGPQAFELMHNELDKIWKELYRVLKPGGLVCINVGDATRKIGKDFQLYSNHARIITALVGLGFQNLPNILWRKQTNAPNKFMGSGMLPPSAYVTLEHEYILIFRKEGKRTFKQDEKENRRASSYFWEERNQWFSDLWDLKGVRQQLNEDESRERSAAYPFEIPYRLINMFSVKGDVVLDPFLGTGTTSLAAMCAGRNSFGYEMDETFSGSIFQYLNGKNLNFLNDRIRKRILDHKHFVGERINEKGSGAFKYKNIHYQFPVITKQEKKLLFNFIQSIEQRNDNRVVAEYSEEAVLDQPKEGTLFAEP
jgi:DNA modification methylase